MRLCASNTRATTRARPRSTRASARRGSRSPGNTEMPTFSEEELSNLKHAKALLENPGLAAKLAAYVGTPVEKGMKMLPKRLQGAVHSATEKALMKALDVAVKSLGDKRPAAATRDASNRMHKMAVATSGAIG